ncbi:hypothetical protein TSAR_010618 [Trichomalopsis sarcophagae]|uniref:Uncharacterized protein n=1 Tax=Trichomalopsis sarcophagae TaxID=543379 RepID=A0A232F7R0_9HYME|nr:hypothetical protein TSAR_010618 [Trichomalopsis sarcophagae]
MLTLTFANSHTTLNAPVLVRSPKLSSVRRVTKTMSKVDGSLTKKKGKKVELAKAIDIKPLKARPSVPKYTVFQSKLKWQRACKTRGLQYREEPSKRLLRTEYRKRADRNLIPLQSFEKCASINIRQQPYYAEYTGSRPITEVKQPGLTLDLYPPPKNSIPSVTILSARLPYEFQFPRHDGNPAVASHSKPNTLASLCAEPVTLRTPDGCEHQGNQITQREEENGFKKARERACDKGQEHISATAVLKFVKNPILFPILKRNLTSGSSIFVYRRTVLLFAKNSVAALPFLDFVSGSQDVTPVSCRMNVASCPATVSFDETHECQTEDGKAQ